MLLLHSIAKFCSLSICSALQENTSKMQLRERNWEGWEEADVLDICETQLSKKKLSFWPNLLYLFPGWAEKAEKSWLPFFVEKAAQWCFSASAAHLLLPKMVVVYQMSNGIISIITKSSRLVHHNFGTLVPNQKVVAQENDQSNRRYWDVRNPKTFVAEQELQWMSFTTKKSHFVPKIVKVGWVRWSELQNLKS